MRKAVKIIIYANYEVDSVSADFEEELTDRLTTEVESNPHIEAAQIEFDYEEE